MASTGWRRRVLEHLYDARGPVTVSDLCELLGAERFRVEQLLLGFEEEWLAVRERAGGRLPHDPAVMLTKSGRSYVERAYRSTTSAQAIAGDG